MKKPQVIFLGNGPLAESALPVLSRDAEIIFHARTKADLARVAEIKKQNPEVFAVLASFGVMIPKSLLELFEPEGILNLHPSLLPKYRGASPIESAILAGDSEFGYSIMKLAPAMDAGPIYHQATIDGLPLEKMAIYRALAEKGAEWITENLPKIRELVPVAQDDSSATYTGKFDKTTDSELKPADLPAWQIYRQIIAFQGFPKPKYHFGQCNCIILEAKLCEEKPVLDNEHRTDRIIYTKKRLFLLCQDDNLVEILRLQPEGKKSMDATGFINGYLAR